LTYVTEEVYGEIWFRFTEVAPAYQKILWKIIPLIEFFIWHPIPEINMWGWGQLKILMRYVRGNSFRNFKACWAVKRRPMSREGKALEQKE